MASSPQQGSSSFYIPKRRHAELIGRQGQFLRDLQLDYHVQISVPPKDGDVNVVTVSGTQNDVADLRKRLEEDLGINISTPLHVWKLQLPSDNFRVIIGKGGATLRNLEYDFRVAINVPRREDADQRITLEGLEPDLKALVEEIRKLTNADVAVQVVPNVASPAVRRSSAQGGVQGRGDRGPPPRNEAKGEVKGEAKGPKVEKAPEAKVEVKGEQKGEVKGEQKGEVKGQQAKGEQKGEGKGQEAKGGEKGVKGGEQKGNNSPKPPALAPSSPAPPSQSPAKNSPKQEAKGEAKGEAKKGKKAGAKGEGNSAPSSPAQSSPSPAPTPAKEPVQVAQVKSPAGGINKVIFFPDKDVVHNPNVNEFLGYLGSAKSTLDVCVFTITDDRIANTILKLKQKGIKTRIITDNDQSAMLGSDIQKFKDAGVSVKMDVSPYHMHHKFAVIDNGLLLNGSFNWTKGASTNNCENIMVTNNSDFVKSFSAHFETMWQDTKNFQ